jgi:lipoyl(octanoyl) transferase
LTARLRRGRSTGARHLDGPSRPSRPGLVPGRAYACDVDSELVFFLAGFGARALPYSEALDLQRELHARRVDGDIPDCCLLLEHQPVYTAGRRTSPLDRPAGDPGAPVIDVDRGGKITWHGPGQLVGYPIVKLADPIDVIAYVRAIEEAMIRTCADFSLAATRVEGRSGAWVSGSDGSPDRKVAAIGIRVARGVTMHGFALNCDNDLNWFDRIVPCGISDASVTSLTAELRRPVTVADAIGPVERHLAGALGARHVSEVASAADLPDEPGRHAARRPHSLTASPGARLLSARARAAADSWPVHRPR